MTDLTSPAVHFFDSHRGAERAIHALHEGGFDVRKLSLVSKGVHSEERPAGFPCDVCQRHPVQARPGGGVA